jgi:hypothetical protein
MDDIDRQPKVVVHTVHGTWPYGLWNQLLRRTGKGKELPWFENGSSFHKAVVILSGRNLVRHAKHHHNTAHYSG